MAIQLFTIKHILMHGMYSYAHVCIHVKRSVSCARHHQENNWDTGMHGKPGMHHLLAMHL